MKKKKILYCIILTFFVVIIILVLLNNYMSYSMRIGGTRFFLVETMATSKEGKPLLGLYFEIRNNGGYKGVEMSGFPRIILWNEKYLISKNYDGKDTTITNYVIINQKSVNSSDGSIADIHIFKREKDYNNYLQNIGLSESDMKTINSRITWWELLFGSRGLY